MTETQQIPLHETPRSIAQLLMDFQKSLPTDGTLTLSDILDTFHERGFGLALLFFALPMALPVPVPPVLNVLLAVPLLLLTVQQILGRPRLWLPRSFQRKPIQTRMLSSVCDKIIPFLRKLEALTKPRLPFLTSHIAQRITGVLGTIMALYVTIPLPLTNTVPSLGIAVMALGVLTRDGLAVLAGALIGLIWVTILTAALLLFGLEGLDLVKETIKSFL